MKDCDINKEKEKLKNNFLNVCKENNLKMMNKYLEDSWNLTLKRYSNMNSDRIYSSTPRLPNKEITNSIDTDFNTFDLPLEEYKIYW